MHILRTGTDDNARLAIARSSGSTNANITLIFRAESVANDETGAIRSVLTSTSAADMAFDIRTGTNRVEAMRLISSGFLGIGTLSPSHTLNVVGDSNITGSNIFFSGLPHEASTVTSDYVCRAADGHLFLNETGCRI